MLILFTWLLLCTLNDIVSNIVQTCIVSPPKKNLPIPPRAEEIGPPTYLYKVEVLLFVVVGIVVFLVVELLNPTLEFEFIFDPWLTWFK